MSTHPFRTAHRLASALALAGLLSAMSSTASRAQQPVDPAAQKLSLAATPEEQARAKLNSETRIRKLHDRLRITADQETLWANVAQVMRSNEDGFRTDLNNQTRDLKNASAVNDLKTFQTIADHHASGLKAFLPPFEKLYDAMPAAQQKRADGLFGEHHRFFQL